MPKEGRTIQEMSVDARMLLKKFSEMKVGDTLSYQVMSELVGRDIKGRAYSCLQTARKAALRDGIVIGTVQKVGVKRLDDESIVRTGASAIHRISRASRRATRVLACVKDFDKLEKDSQVRHNSALSILAVLGHIASPASQRRLESKVKDIGVSLPLQRTLEALK